MGIGRNAINKYVQLFKTCDIEMNDLLSLESSALKELFSNKTTINNDRYDELMRYFARVNESKNHPGFTFLYHYLEYKAAVSNPYSYTQFMEHYRRRHTKVKGSMKLEHKAGYEMMIDYAGKHLHITDKETGEQVFPK